MLLKIQDIIGSAVNIVLSLLRILILSKFSLKIPKKKSDTIYVLGNGPSLNETLSDAFEKLKAEPCFAVNNFAFSSFYEVLKPSYYLISAPEYFMEKPPTQFHIDAREKLFKELVEKTSWELSFIVPGLASKTSFWKESLSRNPNIKIFYFNNTPVEGPEWFTNYIFSKGLGMPRPHNVLIPAIFMSINMGFNKILVFGADHSWHEDVRVDENNEMTVDHKHFYDDGHKRGVMHKLDGQKYYFHDLLRKLYLAFKGHFILNKYAAHRQAKILNASKKSYIDAFEKIKF